MRKTPTDGDQTRIRAKVASVKCPEPVRCRAMALLVLTLLLSFPCTGLSGTLDNLNLANRFEQGIKITEKIGNPHDFSCSDCHPSLGPGKNMIQYLVDDDTVTLCTSCHTPSHLHPVGIDATPPERRASVWLPLGRGKFFGKIVCLTCHYVHANEFRANLLRGDNERGKSRQDQLCSACHTTALVARSPHNPESKSCGFCHTTIPERGKPLARSLNLSVQASCDFCHGALGNGHFLSVNPFADPEITWRFDKVGIPLVEGRFTCVSCHDPHAYQNRKIKMLRSSYLALAARSQHVNPHWKEVMCISCHDGVPGKGSPVLRFDGDINRLCDRCHNGLFARRDIHPVGIEPSGGVAIPGGWPLVDNRITCETCHDSSLQEGGEGKGSVGKKNPKFLRGGIKTRNEFCFRCHKAEVYGKLDAHNQIGVYGTVHAQSCLFCHTSMPDIQVLGIETVSFNAERLDDYCTCCHNIETENHPRGAHMVVPSEKIRMVMENAISRIGVELPLYEGRITCATCHNPHEAGVIRMEAAARGSDKANRLRLGDPWLICQGCHADKG